MIYESSTASTVKVSTVQRGAPRQSADSSLSTSTLEALQTTAYPSVQNSASPLLTATSQTASFRITGFPTSSSLISNVSLLILSAILPFASSSSTTETSQSSASFGSSGRNTAGQGLAEKPGKASSGVYVIISCILASVLAVAALLTIYFCRRIRHKRNQRPIITPSSPGLPLFEPRKHKRRNSRDTLSILESLFPHRQNERPNRPYSTRSMTCSSPRRLAFPKPAFAPLRAHRSSKSFSRSNMDDEFQLPSSTDVPTASPHPRRPSKLKGIIKKNADPKQRKSLHEPPSDAHPRLNSGLNSRPSARPLSVVRSISEDG